jgi:integrase
MSNFSTNRNSSTHWTASARLSITRHSIARRHKLKPIPLWRIWQAQCPAGPDDNGGGRVREYRCPARHRIVPYTSIRKSLSSAGKSSGLGHVRPHDLRHTFVTRMLDLSVPIEQVNYLAGHESMAMTKRYGAAIEVLDTAGNTSSAEALAAARWKQTYSDR